MKKEFAYPPFYRPQPNPYDSPCDCCFPTDFCPPPPPPPKPAPKKKGCLPLAALLLVCLMQENGE